MQEEGALADAARPDQGNALPVAQQAQNLGRFADAVEKIV
jgi:hypothetical protein